MNLELLRLQAKKYTSKLLEPELLKPMELSNIFNTPDKAISYIEQVSYSLLTFPDLQKLFDLNILSHYLIYHEKLPDTYTRFLEKAFDISIFFPTEIWSALLKGKWTAVPVFMSHNSKSFIKYFFIGMIPGSSNKVIFPEFAEKLLGNSSKSAILNACENAKKLFPMPRESIFLCYPLSLPPVITGGSLGLPLALGFISLLTGENIVPRTGVTGRLDKKGFVKKVGSLDLKISKAGKQGFKFMIYPEDNEIVNAECSIKTIPVSCLEHAHMFSVLYLPEQHDDLVLFKTMINNPAIFIANCENIDLSLISWACDKDRIENIIKVICEDTALFKRYVDKLDSLVKTERKKAEKLASCISEKQLEKLTKVSPESAFRFYDIRFAMENHNGNIQKAIKFSKSAQDILEKNGKGSISIEYQEKFRNHNFIFLHNRYIFKPDLPDDFREIFDYYNKQHHAPFGFVDRKMGRIYGSLAQNYAFQGPEHLEKAIETAQKARVVFCEEKDHSFKEDSLRQYNYMFYAYMDAGNEKKGLECLLLYFEIDNFEMLPAIFPELTPYQHTALARFFAEYPDYPMAKDYLRFSSNIYESMVEGENFHPWQLWCYNLGRLCQYFNKSDLCHDYYLKSLNLSIESDETIQIMALLPLSALMNLGWFDGNDLPRIENIIKQAAKTLDNPDFFKPLFDTDIKTVLKLVYNEPRIFFPFTYR